MSHKLSKKGGPFELVERPIPEPDHGQVLIKIDACGVCHSDAIFKEGNWPGMKFPFVCGHEVTGHVEKIGSHFSRFKVGQAVGVGWNGGYCSHCEPCREGEFPYCTTGATTAVAFDGGYGEYMVAPETAVAAMPDGLDPVEAGPLLCAGVTTYNALRKSGANSGDLVAIQGIGGLGHLAVQFAAKSGYHTVAISRGRGQGGVREAARRARLYRRHEGRCGRATAGDGRREGDPGHGAERKGDQRAGRRTEVQEQAGRCRGAAR